MVKRYRNGWWLAIKYHDEGMTQREIADECDVSPRAIRKYMREFGIETREVEGENHGLYGTERDEEVKERIAETLEGREFDEEARKRISEAGRGREVSETVREKISNSLSGLTRPESTRRKMSEATAGEQNPNWKGGHSRRYGSGWTIARERVHNRDEVCQHCGVDKSERKLEVHHIVPLHRFHQAPDAELSDAHDLENLVLVCEQCHLEAHYGKVDFETEVRDPLCD